jgi:DNA mismatch repair protein MutS
MPRAKKVETSGAGPTVTKRGSSGKTGVEEVGMKMIVGKEMETKTVSKSEPKALIDYFVKQSEWYVSHGPNIFVVYQIGVFYEYYAKVISGLGSDLLASEVVYNPESSFATFLDLTDFKIMDKKIVLDGYAVMGAGFRDTQLENYISKLTDAGYTVVVYSQKETKKDGLQERFLDGVYSPGTYLPCVVADVGRGGVGGGKKSNHMMCIWAEILRFSSSSPSSGGRGGGIVGGHRSFIYKLHIGVSVMDIYSGASSLFEYEVVIERSKAFDLSLSLSEFGGSDIAGIGPEFVYTPALMDELERSIYTHQPTEIIMIGKGEILDAIDNYAGIQHVMKHRVLLEEGLVVGGGAVCVDASSTGSGSGVGMSNIEKAFRCTKQKYIHGILVSLYGEKVVNQCSEFDMYLYATRAFCYMINFIGEHRSELITKLVLPEFYNTSDRVVLANHTLKQLNILEVEDSKGMGVECRLQSVVGFLNRCRTAMGQRMIQTQITNPTFCEEWLEKEYAMTDMLLGVCCVGGLGGVGDWIEWLRMKLSGVKDLEKMCRQLLLSKLSPNHLHHLYLSLEIILNIETQIKDSGGFGKDWFAYFSDKMADGVGFGGVGDIGGDKLRELLKYIRFNVDLEACSGNSSLTSFDKPVVVDEEITYIINQIETGEAAFSKMAADLNGLLGQDWVRWKTTEKGTMSLEMTKIRGGILQAKISEALDGVDADTGAVLWLKGLTIKTERGENSVCISNPELVAFSYKNVSLHEQLSSCSSKLYLRFLSEFCMKWYEVIDWYAKYTGWLDVLVCKAFLAREYHYCRPICSSGLSSDDSHAKSGDSGSEISSMSCSHVNGCDGGGGYEVNCGRKGGEDDSYVVAKGLRHVLIEHLQQREIYVANDLSLGGGDFVSGDGENGKENAKGCLIYGTNAVGKTSLIRSLGIAIIMAQAGFYVPCSSFVYKPYTAIYSRILGNDNLFKGMSTFEVEMSELRVILREADSRSLILGDELCSGTEMESALSIFVASLEHLVRKGGSFLFATHFHEIAYYPEIESLIQKGGLTMKHLTVHFDAKSGKLIYDRRLKSGPGNALYGLEVCKSLYLPLDFVERAYEIRRIHGNSGLAGLRIDGENRSVISLENNPSVYNASKIRGICENCGLERSEEVHHKIPQKLADSRGFIVSSETGGVFHKNHAANLMNLCHKCHLKMHG